MSEHMYKVIELIGTSPESWEKAASQVVEEAAKHLRDLRIAEVSEMDMQITDGKVASYRVKVRVSFKYHPAGQRIRRPWLRPSHVGRSSRAAPQPVARGWTWPPTVPLSAQRRCGRKRLGRRGSTVLPSRGARLATAPKNS